MAPMLPPAQSSSLSRPVSSSPFPFPSPSALVRPGPKAPCQVLSPHPPSSSSSSSSSSTCSSSSPRAPRSRGLATPRVPTPSAARPVHCAAAGASHNSSSSSSSSVGVEPSEGAGGRPGPSEEAEHRALGEGSSWDATDALGRDYLYLLGKESDNLSITVGAKEGAVDQVFIGDFLGKEADIVFKYRQKVTRSFEHLQGDYYIAPAFLDKVVTFLAKNYLCETLGIKVPLILGVWGGKGQGKTFQVELIFKALGVEPIILSAGEMESEWAGQPGELIRSRYRDAHMVIKNRGKMSCLMVNDLDAGIGRFAHTQCTVNNQMVVGTLMNLCDNPTRVSIGQEWREEDEINRVPIIVTGNDFSTLWAPLIRDGRMEKFYWQPTREDIVNIVQKMYEKDGISRGEIETLVDTFPDQPLDFFGALRARTYDEKVLEWVEAQGGCSKVGAVLVKRHRRGEDPPEPPTVEPPVQTIKALIKAGMAMKVEQDRMNQSRLSDEYMKVMTGPGVGIGLKG